MRVWRSGGCGLVGVGLGVEENNFVKFTDLTPPLDPVASKPPPSPIQPDESPGVFKEN